MKIKNSSYRSMFKTDTGRIAAPAPATGLASRQSKRFLPAIGLSVARMREGKFLPGAAAVLAATVLGGCMMTPHTTIQGTLNGSPFVVKAPKDGDLTGFDLVAGSNGVIHVHIDHLAVKMNPDVISQTGIAQTAIIKATGDAVSGAAAAAVAGAVQGLRAAQ
jgi:hypothetical protein